MRSGPDPARLLPPAARAALDRHPLTDAERAPHADCPLGDVASWYYRGAGGGVLALALHDLTGLPLVGVLCALEGDAGLGDLPLEVMLEAGIGDDGARILSACGWRGEDGEGERFVGVDEASVRALCHAHDGTDPDDPPTAAAARAAARFLLARVGRPGT
jgi:hypothetical protein